jgi:hypothetical protein
MKRPEPPVVSNLYLKSTINGSPRIALKEGNNFFKEAGRANATINVTDGKASISCENEATARKSPYCVPLVRIKHPVSSFSDVNSVKFVNKPHAFRVGESIVVGRDADAPGNCATRQLACARVNALPM